MAEPILRIGAIDAHVAGAVVRLVSSGFPVPRGERLADRDRWLAKRHDRLCRALVLEPRGHEGVTLALLLEPVTPGADAAVLFRHASGSAGLCGHGLIGALTIAVERHLLVPRDRARVRVDTLGGIVEARVTGLPIGLGTHAQWDRKLDGLLAQSVMAVQAIKGVEIGMGFEAAGLRGSQVHDPIGYDPSTADGPTQGFTRPTNNAGGLEGGTTNGQPLVIRAAMKPISTLRKPLASVNLTTKQPEEAAYERSDVCAVSACSVIVENVVAFTVAQALVDKFGGDSITEMKARWSLYHDLACSH